jgi:hypothetical protein
MSQDYANRERSFAVVERQRAEVERRRASAGGREEATHAWAAVMHERVAALHDRAADLHGRTANLQCEDRMNFGPRRLAGRGTRCVWCGTPLSAESDADDWAGVDDGATAHRATRTPPIALEIVPTASS